MADNSNFLSTPDGYATPNQLKEMRDYGAALLYGKMQQPVQHWSQGVSNMVSALVGGGLDYNAAQKEKAAEAGFGKNYMPPDPLAGNSTPSGTKMSGGDAPLSAAGKSISSIESGGNYAELGPVIDKGSYAGDRAYGKYQVMGKNVGPWTKETFGQEMTPEQFLQSPQAQEAVYKTKFGQLAQKYGPEGAARAWFAGEGGMNDPNRKDQLGTSVADYSRKFVQNGGTGGSTAFAGPSSSEVGAAPAVQAMTAALRGGATPPDTGEVQVAANGKAMPGASPAQPTQTPPQGAGNQIYINPAAVPRQPQYTREQVQNILSSPWATPQQKETIRNAYIQQNQPIVIDMPGVGKVAINPRDPTQQTLIREGHWGESKIGDISHPQLYFGNPDQTVTQAPINQGVPTPTAPNPVAPGVGPRSDAGPAPVLTPPQGATTAPGVGAVPVAENAPTAPAEAVQAPVKVASTDPTAGITAAGSPVEQPNKLSPSPYAPLAQVVNNSKAPPGVSQTDWDAYTALARQKKDIELEKQKGVNDLEVDKHKSTNDLDVDKQAREKNNELGAKRYDNIQESTKQAIEQISNLNTASAMMHDNGFYSGFANGAVENIKKVQAALGIDPNAAAPMEVFRKTMASSIANGLKAAYGGLGQIRNKEIELQEKANGSLATSPAANRALIEISRRSAEKVAQIGELAQEYRLGNEVVDPITGETLAPANMGADGQQHDRPGLDPGYDKLVTKFAKAHPTFSPDEYKHFNEALEGKLDQPSAGQAITLPDVAQKSLKQGTVTTFGNGQMWTLGSDGKPKQVTK